MENLELIKKGLKKLERIRRDDEAAHSFEDDLREKVLKDIASGKYTLDECKMFATEVLKTNEIYFSRWCA